MLVHKGIHLQLSTDAAMQILLRKTIIQTLSHLQEYPIFNSFSSSGQTLMFLMFHCLSLYDTDPVNCELTGLAEVCSPLLNETMTS